MPGLLFTGQHTRARLFLAVALMAVAIFLPPHALAASLTGGRTDLLADAVKGAWIFKVLLALHAAILFFAGRLQAASRASDPLLNAASSIDGVTTSAREWAILAAILTLGAVLRLYALGEGLWHDEILALVRYGRLSAGEILTTYDSQNQHMLYSLLARLSIWIFGESAWALRLPAAAFGIASLWAVYWFGSQVTSRREALLASALLSVSYHHVWFSQNARGYSAMLLWTLVSSGLFLRLLRRREPHGFTTVLPYALVSALAVYTQVAAVFVVAAHFVIWVWLIIRARSRPLGMAAWMPLAAFVLATTLSLQLYALAIPQFLATITAPSKMAGVTTEWKNPIWFIAETVRGLSGGLPGGMLFVLCAAIIAGTGIVSFWRRSAAVPAMLLLPGAITAIGMLATAHNLWPRLFFFSAGFAVLIAIRGLFALASLALPRRASLVATAAMIALIAGSAATTPRAWRPKQDHLGAWRYVERARGDGDAVVTVDMSHFAYQRYIATGWTPVESLAELEALERTHRKTWVVYTFPARLSAMQPEIWERLEKTYSPAARFRSTVGGGAIVVKVLDGGARPSRVGKPIT
ncbi:MAG: glycosyltransferase family 39 protein [Anaerolineae bacterium]|nr:glycosyltransferase family 39 protein [Gemmatimonadaceae bacterium]